MSYTLYFLVDGQYVSAECASPEQASTLWDVLSQSPDCQMVQTRPLREVAFNHDARKALHDRMDYAVSINSATTGYDAHTGLFTYMATHGCLDAPQYVATGSTEGYEACTGFVPIATTRNRRW